MSDLIDFISKAGPTAMFVAGVWLVWRGELVFKREIQQRDDRIEEGDQRLLDANARIATLEKEARSFTRESLEERRKERESYRSEIGEIRKTMHALIQAFSHPGGPEPAP